MIGIVDFISVRSPKVFEEYRNNIRAQVAELLGNTPIDESRIATEVVLFADKMCVDEELVRLRSHIEKMKSDLTQAALPAFLPCRRRQRGVLLFEAGRLCPGAG